MVGNRARSLKRTSRIALREFRGQLLIREEEPEVSLIDYLAILVVRADGTMDSLHVADPRLRAIDNQPIRLRMGDSLPVAVPYRLKPGDRVHLVTNGYYVPIPSSMVRGRRHSERSTDARLRELTN
jgi:hypothetical protein